MTSLLAALASLPRIASALEMLAKTFTEINRRAVKAKAASRRKDKDDEVDERIAALVGITTCRMPDDEAE
jgi:predicted RNase H-like nuclease